MLIRPWVSFERERASLISTIAEKKLLLRIYLPLPHEKQLVVMAYITLEKTDR